MRVLIIGGGRGGNALFKTIHATKQMKIVAVISDDLMKKELDLVRKNKIPVDDDWKKWINKDIDIIVEATGEEDILQYLRKYKGKQTIVVPYTVAQVISELFEDKKFLLDKIKNQMNRQNIILDNIRDGMIVVDKNGMIQFINKSTEKIVGITKEASINKHINDVIPSTRLPDVLAGRKKEVNQKLALSNGKKIITTRIPMINDQDDLIGAFAIFKDITEVVNLAEENTDLKEVKTMLEAIFQSSDEAISVVDEKGIGLMINPAYTRLTGLKEEAIIGKPATADISEGESMHMKVLQTEKPVRGTAMKVGPSKKDVLVNVAPVIVDNILKGSVGVIHDVSEIRKLTSELKKAHQKIRSLEANYTFKDIIGPSPEMTIAIEQAKIGAKTPAIVLLRGESGTGKELFAHAIHNESDRRHKRFIRVNCAAIAESLLESELFGYEDGAFTGARTGGKKGVFEEANHGSIFLDEIGELSLSTQAKILRVLQEGEIVRVGGTKPISLDIRIIAATNRNLEKGIMNKTFREDLYYRLNRLPITIPSLRERLSDLLALTQHAIAKTNQEYGRTVRSIDEEALDYLKQHHWPGNIRELENIIGRAMIYMSINEDVIKRKHIPDLNIPITKHKQVGNNYQVEENNLKQTLDLYEKEIISKVYKNNNYNKTETAKDLEISLRSLYYKISKFQIE